jgi:hypothetical protein
MAEIDVERKSSPTWIWWLLGLIVLGLIAWVALSGDDPEPADTIAPAPVSAPEVPNGETDLAGLPGGLRNLAAAPRAMWQGFGAVPG